MCAVPVNGSTCNQLCYQHMVYMYIIHKCVHLSATFQESHGSALGAKASSSRNSSLTAGHRGASTREPSDPSFEVSTHSKTKVYGGDI